MNRNELRVTFAVMALALVLVVGLAATGVSAAIGDIWAVGRTTDGLRKDMVRVTKDGHLVPGMPNLQDMGTWDSSWNTIYGNYLVAAQRVETGGLAVKVRTSAVDCGIYNTDAILGVTSTDAPRKVTLDDSRKFAPGQLITVKDQGGLAGTYAIEIYGYGSDVIDGGASTRLTQNSGSKRLYKGSNGFWYTY